MRIRSPYPPERRDELIGRALTWLELFNLLINPLSHDFALRWHRDDVRETASQEEEIEALGKWHAGVSTCPLFVVPKHIDQTN